MREDVVGADRHALAEHGSTLDLRPVFHRLDRRIRAHVTLCMIALFLDRIIELQTGMPFEQVRKLFARLRAASSPLVAVNNF